MNSKGQKCRREERSERGKSKGEGACGVQVGRKVREEKWSERKFKGRGDGWDSSREEGAGRKVVRKEIQRERGRVGFK